MSTARFMWLSVVMLCVACRDGDETAVVQGPLVIYSTTDTAVFLPVIEDFKRLHPRVDVRYVDIDAGPLNTRYLEEERAGKHSADLLLSSAMDLQVKLVNDGYAVAHVSPNGVQLPAWARWRNEAVGITFEPAVLVYNRKLLAERQAPRSRPELLDALRQDAEFWRERVGTYDIDESAVGYLLASQDARLNSEFGSLLEALGSAGIRTAVTSADLLDQLERGDLVLGYNLLGSYARTRAEQNSDLLIVYPEDYTLAVSRTAVLSKNAPHPQAAHAFLEYLLSLRGQQTLAARSQLSAARPEIVGPYSQMGIAERQVGPIRPIPLGPGLLTYLDDQKRRRLIESWNRAVVRAPRDAMTGR
jgi:iron(III) transport system substrate-binding protein